MKAIALVIVAGGVADEVAPPHVDVRIVDIDNIKAGDSPPGLPRDVGFEDLVRRAQLIEGEEFTWEDRRSGDVRRVSSQPYEPDRRRTIPGRRA